MEEILRLVNVSQDQTDAGQNRLRGYYLEIYRSELVYIQGLKGSGVHALSNVLSGKDAIDGGKIYIKGHEVPLNGRKRFYSKNIYVCAGVRDLIGNMTVAENLCILGPDKSPFRIYDVAKVEKQIAELLLNEQLPITPETTVSFMNYTDKLKLCLVKAKFMKAELVVIDCKGILNEVINVKVLSDMINAYKSEGISFIVLSERMNSLVRIADRIQIMERGRDRMEMSDIKGDDQIDKMFSIIYGNKDNINRRGLELYRDQRRGEEAVKFIGLVDVLWETDMEISKFLHSIVIYNRQFWKEEVNLEIPIEGEISSLDMVLIPRESATCLPNNLSIAENVILSIPRRISKIGLGYIPPALQENAVQNFYRIAKVTSGKRMIRDLDYVEKKVLSIFRWEMARPKAIILEDPFWAMTHMEIQSFLVYLQHLENAGVQVVLCSQSLSEIAPYCHKIIVTENARDARWYHL